MIPHPVRREKARAGARARVAAVCRVGAVPHVTQPGVVVMVDLRRPRQPKSVTEEVLDARAEQQR